MTFGKKTLFSLLLGFDLLANILELTHVNFLYASTLISFCTYILLPGFLISLILRVRKISFWENLLFIVGFSIAFLEFGGLLLNILFPLFGINDPLAFQNLVVGFDISVSLLFIFAWLRTKSLIVQIHLPNHSAIENVLYTLPLFFPILAALGAIVLNNGGSDILTLILLGTIAFYSLLLVLLRNKIPVDLYPYALFFIGLASLFTTSLRSWYITGHDIETEFYIFKITNAHHLWNMAFLQDAYNACLSITILPTILTNLLSIQDIYVYKVIFQILFATSPVLVFFILRNYTTPVFAFLSAFVFMCFPTFFTDMAMLNRQEIGFIFFGLVLYVMLNSDRSQQFFSKAEVETVELAAVPGDHSEVELETVLLAAVMSNLSASRSVLSSNPGAVVTAAPLELDESNVETVVLSTAVTKAANESNVETVVLSAAVTKEPEVETVVLSAAATKAANEPEVETVVLAAITGDRRASETAVANDLPLSLRRTLFIIFALSVIVSHYSTNFVLLAIVAFVYISTFILSRAFMKNTFAFLLSTSHIRLKNTFPNKVFLSLPLILILFGATYFWNTLYTHSSNHASSVLVEVVSSIFVSSNIDKRSSDLSDSIFFAHKSNPQQDLQKYINSIRHSEGSNATNDQSITNKYPTYTIPQEQIAPTPLGNLLSSFNIPVFNIQAELRSAAADLFQIFVFVGLLIVFFVKNKKTFDLQYLLLCFGSLFLLALITVLPELSKEYGALRMFQQFLFLLSLPIVLGISSVFFFLKEQKRILFTGIIVIILFLDLTGFLSHLTGDYYPQLTLDNSGIYYDAYYVDKPDVSAIVWLSENNVNKELVVADLSNIDKLRSYGYVEAIDENFPGLVPPNTYVYLEVSSNRVVALNNTMLIYTSDKPFLDANKDTVYSNGGVNIYK